MPNDAWIAGLTERALEADRVRLAGMRLQEKWPESLPPLGGLLGENTEAVDPLGHLLSVSPISLEKLLNDPHALVWLLQPGLAQAPRAPRRMLADYEALLRDTLPANPAATRPIDERFRTLRHWKQREMLRIALREVAGWASVEETTLDLSQVAEICVRTVVEGWMTELSRRWGKPATDFAVLGMGKFGGQELNYSSDIDVIFFYGEEGHLNPRFTHQEFFRRLAEKIVATFSAADAAGALFRIDLRLRPEGASGALVRSLDSMEHYYSAFGETWERMALIKARVIAGSEELGYEFTHRLQPFIYPRTVSLDVVEEIRAIKGRIEREIVGASAMKRNVKLGYGGIREIEFVAQTLQLLHGARHAFLQERNTLKVLRALRQLDILPHEQMQALLTAYRVLRTVEHRLQIENEAQTHLLPERPDERELLARSLARSGLLRISEQANGAETLREFDEFLESHTATVRAIFEATLGRSAPAPSLDLSFFRNHEHARQLLDDLDGSAASARFSPGTRKLALQLEPLLLDWLRRIADPDAALTRFIHFFERYGSRRHLLATFLRNPKLLELMVRLFDASRSMSDIVLRRPQLFEDLARGGGLGETRHAHHYLSELEHNEEGLPWRDWLRAFRRAQLLRIGLRDVLDLAKPVDLQREFSALAEACLFYAQRELGHAGELTIVAMGKFGGRELSYGADLDVVFIGDNNKAAGEIMRAMSETTAEGTVFHVDPRLRPEGEGGPLTCTLSRYESYFESRAQLWEAQALTKARPISGPSGREYLELAQRIWRRFGAREDLFPQIAAMHARVMKERSTAADALEFKTGRGGIMQAEFFTQAHQMRAGVWEPNTLDALDALARSGAIAAEVAAGVGDAYRCLRRVESILRRMEDKSVSTVPRDPVEQLQLARRCGFEDWTAFYEQYSRARETIERHAQIVPA